MTTHIISLSNPEHQQQALSVFSLLSFSFRHFHHHFSLPSSSLFLLSSLFFSSFFSYSNFSPLFSFPFRFFLSSFAFYLINVLADTNMRAESEKDENISVPLCLIIFKRNKMFIIIVLLMARKGCAPLASFLHEGVEVIIT